MKKPRSIRQREWSSTLWKNHRLAGVGNQLIETLTAYSMYAEAGQVAAAIKKAQAANIRTYKDRWPKKLADKKGVDKSPTA